VSDSLTAALFSLERLALFFVVGECFWLLCCDCCLAEWVLLLLAAVDWFVYFSFLLCGLDVLVIVGDVGYGCAGVCMRWCMHPNV